MGKKRIALFHGTDNYGTTAAKTLNNEISRYPEASIVIEEKFEVADTNMIPQLTRIKSANPDLLIIYTAGTTGAIIAKNYKQMGLKVPVLASSGMAIPQFVKIAGPIAEEYKWVILGTRVLVGEKFPESHAFRKTLYDPLKTIIKSKFGDSKEIVTFHVGPFDGMRALVEALKAGGTDGREQLRDALEKVRVSEGFLGTWECSPDDHQAAKKDVMIPLVIKNGEWFPYEAL
jgi:branched-chain amino acid transport system substrate-binding protein